MKKGYIVSWFNSGRNYGQTLQAYALQKKLNELGYDVKHICFGTNRISNPSFVQRINDFDKLNKRDRLKQSKFDDFINSNMKVTDYCKNQNDIKKCIESHGGDFLICGSDQVWNPYNCDPIFYLYDITERPVTRIAYAVSTCDCKRANKFNEYPDVKVWVKGFDAIFVRENSGKTIVKHYLHQDSEVVLDPTLLFSGDEWKNNLSLKLKDDGDRYLLVYSFIITDDQRKKIELQAKKIGCYVKYGDVLLNGSIDNTELWSPVEFLEAILNAQMVFTDSFHGTVFSILFHKDFYVFDNGIGVSEDPYYNFDRMNTLLTLIGLEDRIEFVPDEASEIDYAKVDNILSERRMHCIKRLTQSIECDYDS